MSVRQASRQSTPGPAHGEQRAHRNARIRSAEDSECAEQVELTVAGGAVCGGSVGGRAVVG
eukprot:3581584-Rhodomonas_salina.1